MPGRRAIRVGHVGGSRRASHRYIYHRQRPHYRHSSFGYYSPYGYWGPGRLIGIVVCGLMIVFIILTSLISVISPSPTAYQNVENLGEDWWIYGEGKVDPGQIISYSVSATDGLFIFFFTTEDPSGWRDKGDFPQNVYEYYGSTATAVGEFDPPYSENWSFVIYNDPIFRQGPIIISYDIQYSSSGVDMSFIFFLIGILLISGTMIGFYVHQKNKRRPAPKPTVKTSSAPSYSQSSSVPRPITIQTAKNAKPRYCVQCGGNLEPGDRFCVDCGTKTI